ncbi:hypothetical protein [Lacinutrix chionoecetis]
MKKLNKLFLLLMLPLFCVSCIVDDDENTGLQGIENTPIIVGFKKSVAVETYFEDIGAVESQYPLDILGGNAGVLSSTDLVVTYEIDPASTATEGVEFDFIDNSGTLTIPAGSSFTQFPLSVNTGGFDPDSPTVLILKLKSVNGGVVSSINDELAITFVGCLADLEGNYSVTTVRLSDNTTYNIGTSFLEEIGTNTFLTETTGQFGLQTTFSVICGAITIEAQNLGGIYSNQVEGTGSVDPVTGDFVIEYTITPLFADPFVAYVSTYINL